MGVTNRFPLWGREGEIPDDGFEYKGGDQVNEKHLNYLWDKIQKQTDDFITKTDALQNQIDNHEDDTTAHGSDGEVVGQNTLDSHTTAVEAHGSDGEIVGQNTLDSHTTAVEAHGSDGSVIGSITFNDHSARHESGGADELNVTGLSGDLADRQDPKNHASRHHHGGPDKLEIVDLDASGGNEEDVVMVQDDGTLAYEEGAGMSEEEIGDIVVAALMVNAASNGGAF